MQARCGITLIALIITIIVLLILAGVTLNLTLGDKGIFKMAKSAVQENEKARTKRRVRVKNIRYTNEKNGTGY